MTKPEYTNYSFDVIIDCNDDDIELLSDHIKKILLSANIRVSMYSIGMATEYAIIKYFVSLYIDYDFAVDILKAELGDRYIEIKLNTMDGELLEKD